MVEVSGSNPSSDSFHAAGIEERPDIPHLKTRSIGEVYELLSILLLNESPSDAAIFLHAFTNAFFEVPSAASRKKGKRESTDLESIAKRHCLYRFLIPLWL